ncbi:hypothetical protein TNCV_1174101 [Trichonephila clavipes]|nr:hypothetical protein TNCV_1174101 [Trichonephila clavipes]
MLRDDKCMSGISTGGRTDIYIIPGMDSTARRYRDEILRPSPTIHFTLQQSEITSFLIDDNSRSHHCNLVEDSLLEEGIRTNGMASVFSDMNQ